MSQEPPSSPKLLRVTAKPARGFRRGGFFFSRDPVELPLESLSASQLAAIKQEPLLDVIVVDTSAQIVGSKRKGSK